MSKKVFFFLAVFVALSQAALYAGHEGTTAAPFLKIAIGARPTALGESFVGVADDANALYWNPAGLANLDSLETTLTAAALFEDIYYGFAGVSKNIPKLKGSLGFSVTYLGMDKMKGFDASGNPASDYTARDTAVGVSYGRRLMENVSLGGTIKTIRQEIETESAGGFGIDLGALYRLDKIGAGITIRNIGPAMGFHEKFSLPMSLRIGASYMLRQNLMLCSDINLPFDYDPSLHIGGEYLYKDVIAFRLGAKTTNIKSLGAVSAITAGFGLKIEKMSFDYVLSPYGDLGVSHRISLGVKFGR
ncbi:MAG: PorV/PorQ family protein [Elusimicrobia bacterium]|nr:PorV/PorQ family protein [Elusimicrobiota bacterium]